MLLLIKVFINAYTLTISQKTRSASPCDRRRQPRGDEAEKMVWLKRAVGGGAVRMTLHSPQHFFSAPHQSLGRLGRSQCMVYRVLCEKAECTGTSKDVSAGIL